MQKLVTIRCDEPIAVDEQYRQPWSDVLISFDDEAIGKKLKFDFTLISLPTLERDIVAERKHLQEHPERDTTTITRLEKIKEALKNGARFYIDAKSPDYTTPTLYTRMEYIDRAETERMLLFFLKILGLTEVQFEWLRPEFIVTVG